RPVVAGRQVAAQAQLQGPPPALVALRGGELPLAHGGGAGLDHGPDQSAAASLLIRGTPRALRQRLTTPSLTPHQSPIAAADSWRTARASSASSSRPEPPPRVPTARQRGQEMRASLQPVMTTSPSRSRQVARAPTLSLGGR